MKKNFNFIERTDLLSFLKEKKFEQPTEVQSKVFNLLNQGKDLEVLSQTGSGKTLSFLLPVFNKIKTLEEQEEWEMPLGCPQALILAPTRELCSQIFQQAKAISHHCKLRIRLLSGSQTFKQSRSLKEGRFDILIGVPSRVFSSAKKGEIKFNEIRYFVMDEADQLVDMGFSKEIKNILNLFPRQLKYSTALFSATSPTESHDFKDSLFPKIKFQKLLLSESGKLQHKIETFNIPCSAKEKNLAALAFVEKQKSGQGIIFCNQQNRVDDLFKFLSEKKPQLKMRMLHGGMEKRQRELSLKSFRDKKSVILVCTDVAARGIDVEGLGWVLNYDLPKMPVYYLHRAGRTGRAGNLGRVYNFITGSKMDSDLITRINESIQKQSSFKITLINFKMKKMAKASKKKKVDTKRKVNDKQSKKKVSKQGKKYASKKKRTPRYKRK